MKTPSSEVRSENKISSYHRFQIPFHIFHNSNHYASKENFHFKHLCLQTNNIQMDKNNNTHSGIVEMQLCKVQHMRSPLHSYNYATLFMDRCALHFSWLLFVFLFYSLLYCCFSPFSLSSICGSTTHVASRRIHYRQHRYLFIVIVFHCFIIAYCLAIIMHSLFSTTSVQKKEDELKLY